MEPEALSQEEVAGFVQRLPQLAQERVLQQWFLSQQQMFPEGRCAPRPAGACVWEKPC